MPAANRSSNAYQLQPAAPPRSKAEETPRNKNKSVKKPARAARVQPIALVLLAFLILLFQISRWVALYGLHNDIKRQTAVLDSLRRENEQTALEIDSLTDASRIERYAKDELGMRKMESSQVVYIQPLQGDSMQRVAKKSAPLSARGILGAFSATVGDALEYLR
ncbi:MAG: septum formation initiator family protein [Clostridiales bacterium]|jgi:cell division protein FtsL|nr:septum formation initiator family protein [Clostridiales bacterium]